MNDPRRRPGDRVLEQNPAYSPLWDRVRSQTSGEEAQATPPLLQAATLWREWPNGRSRQPFLRRLPQLPANIRTTSSHFGRKHGCDAKRFCDTPPDRTVDIQAHVIQLPPQAHPDLDTVIGCAWRSCSRVQEQGLAGRDHSRIRAAISHRPECIRRKHVAAKPDRPERCGSLSRTCGCNRRRP